MIDAHTISHPRRVLVMALNTLFVLHSTTPGLGLPTEERFIAMVVAARSHALSVRAGVARLLDELYCKEERERVAPTEMHRAQKAGTTTKPLPLLPLLLVCCKR